MLFHKVTELKKLSFSVKAENVFGESSQPIGVFSQACMVWCIINFIVGKSDILE